MFSSINKPISMLKDDVVNGDFGWKKVPIRTTSRGEEPLVPIGIFSKYPLLHTSSVYFGEHDNSPYPNGLDGSVITLFMRQSVAVCLTIAAGLLPKGCYLQVMDAYRPKKVQSSLYKHYFELLEQRNPEWGVKELAIETQKYVSIASVDPAKPSPHNSGAAVDVVLVKVDADTCRSLEAIDSQITRHGAVESSEELHVLGMERSRLLRNHSTILNFGTPFDDGSSKAAIRYYEDMSKLPEHEQEARNNRRLLCGIMLEAGFAPLASEWWHFNHAASQWGAYTLGLPYAEYGPVELSQENLAFEKMRREEAKESRVSEVGPGLQGSVATIEPV